MMIEEPFRCVSIRIRIEHLDDIAKNQKIDRGNFRSSDCFNRMLYHCTWISVNFSGGAQQIFVRVIQ